MKLETQHRVEENSQGEHGAIQLHPKVHVRTGREARNALHQRYISRLVVNPKITRALVTFQSNKSTPYYRWLKYKEGFSHDFVRFILEQFRPPKVRKPRVLDPFAGAGTTLTTALSSGWQAFGIELLPVGLAAMRARLVSDVVDLEKFAGEFDRLLRLPLLHPSNNHYSFPHLKITAHAFPDSTEKAIGAFMEFLDKIHDDNLPYLFWFAALSILEDISFTRKDGQYLRWDHRSGRALRSHFDKGNIFEFKTALLAKLKVIREDLEKRNGGTFNNTVRVIEGSCLDELPVMPKDRFHLVLTSPPYCNRYDYTRTYALELAFFNYDEIKLRNLRQTLLSATVENRTKRKMLLMTYSKLHQEHRFKEIERSFNRQSALQEVLGLLHEAREMDDLNNPNIVTMVENYFFEMNLVIHELARVLAPGGHVVMVNDNVQYHGEEIPVDLILSDFAESAGLSVDIIWVLPRGKGNSSQQMGVHGRNELRKCVYVWSKPTKAA